MSRSIPKVHQSVVSFCRTHHVFRHFLVAVLLVVVLFQAAVDYLVYRRVYQNGDVSGVSHLIIAAVDNLHQPVPVEAATGKQYLAQFRIVFPADTKNELGPLDYSYFPPIDTAAPLLQITQHRIVKAAEAKLLSAGQGHSIWQPQDPTEVFEQVPSLQACSRGVYVLFDDVDVKQYGEGLQPRGTKQLADGRTLRFFTEQPQRCSATNFDSLITYLKTAQSY
jgi:hypothetical protein